MSAAGVTLSPLDGMGLLAFSGEDAQSFLQGQLSCDVSVVANGKSTYGSYCTPQGRMLATFLLWSSGGRYFMQLPVSLCESIRKRLSMYVLRAKVKVEDASGNHALFGIAGDGAARAIEAVFGGAPAAASHSGPTRPGFPPDAGMSGGQVRLGGQVDLVYHRRCAHDMGPFGVRFKRLLRPRAQ